MGLIKNMIATFMTLSILGLFALTSAAAENEKAGPSALEAELQESFTRYVCQHTGKRLADVSVSKFKVVGNQPLPAGIRTIRVFQQRASELEGYVRLSAIISVDGTAVNKVKLYGWVDIFDTVVIASRDIKKGITIERGDIETVRKNISHLPPDTLKDPVLAVGLRTKHSLRKGFVIKAWMLEKTPVVERGDVVTIVAAGGNLRVTVPGIIKETGFTGDLVKVQNTMSRKEIFARVVNSSTVTVHF